MAVDPHDNTVILPSKNNHSLLLGLDVGSTTVKLVVLEDGRPFTCMFEHYKRHCFDVWGGVTEAFSAAAESISNACKSNEVYVTACVTGSAGTKLAEVLGLPYVQGIMS